MGESELWEMTVSRSQRAVVVRMVDDGQPLAVIAAATEVSEEEINQHLPEWLDEFSSIRFARESRELISPSRYTVEAMRRVNEAEARGDVEGMARAAAPVAMKRLIDVSMNGADKEALGASTQIMNYAGHKPKERIEVYSHIDRMTRAELEAQVRSAILGHPDVVKQLLGRRELEAVEAEIEEDDGGS